MTATAGADILIGDYDTLQTQITTNTSSISTINASSPLTRIGCRIRRAANQSIANNTGTDISFDTEDQDTSGFFAPTSTTVTIPAGLGGIYVVTVVVVGTTGGRSLCDVKLSSSITGMPTIVRNGQQGSTENRMSAWFSGPLAAADTVACTVLQNSGGAANYTAWMSVYRMGA
jgi:hypothetical protein